MTHIFVFLSPKKLNISSHIPIKIVNIFGKTWKLLLHCFLFYIKIYLTCFDLISLYYFANSFFLFFNWDSPHARLDCHYRDLPWTAIAWIY